MARPLVSIIVPAYEEKGLTKRIEHLHRQFPNTEIIVVVTSSQWHTPNPHPRKVTYIHAPGLRTRAQAMNRGGKEASGDMLLFLHADTTLPLQGIPLIAAAYEKGAIGGAFTKKYVPATWPLRCQSRLLNTVARMTGRGIVGTNGIFVRRDIFGLEGGYPDVPLFEDVLLHDRIRRFGRPFILAQPIAVDSRGYDRWAGIPQILRNACLYGLFRCGISPTRLARHYRPRSQPGN